MPIYNLRWNCIPLGAIEHFLSWWYPGLGRGVYMPVVATTDDRTTDSEYVGFYIGMSCDLGRRWHEHVYSWFLHPPDHFWIPANADDFLRNPVAVFNGKQLRQQHPDGNCIQRRILDRSWFAFAEISDAPMEQIAAVEYVLQEGLKQHAGIKVDGYVGDATNRPIPEQELTITNQFCRHFLNQTLPREIVYGPGDGIRINPHS